MISAERAESMWSFTVMGTKGAEYKLSISTSVRCNCIDYRMKRKPCKHIYFIVTQVAQNINILDYFRNNIKISEKAYRELDFQLMDRLKSRLSGESSKKDPSEIDLKDDKDCTVCFTEMDKLT